MEIKYKSIIIEKMETLRPVLLPDKNYSNSNFIKDFGR